MTTLGHLTFLRENRDKLREPVLIVGSCLYEYDEADFGTVLAEAGLTDVTGIDIVDGPGVDHVVDICDAAAFVEEHRGRFATVLCMEMITHVPQPFVLGTNVTELVQPGGTVFLSECIVRKVSRMPTDHWRFTYTGIQLLFPALAFDDSRARMSLPRSHAPEILPYELDLPEIMSDRRHADETAVGWFVRRFHRRFLSRGLFRLSRLMPEVAIMSVATKPV